MPYIQYFIATCVLYFTEIIGAILIVDIGLIFEFISAISISSLAFIFPGVFYIIAERKFATTHQKLEKKRTRYAAYFFTIFGIACMIF